MPYSIYLKLCENAVFFKPVGLPEETIMFVSTAQMLTQTDTHSTLLLPNTQLSATGFVLANHTRASQIVQSITRQFMGTNNMPPNEQKEPDSSWGLQLGAPMALGGFLNMVLYMAFANHWLRRKLLRGSTTHDII